MRDVLTVVMVVLTSPLWLACRVEALLSGATIVFTTCVEALSLVPGIAGVFARRAFYPMVLESCAFDVWVGFGTTFAHRRSRVGRRVYIGNRCTLGMVEINDDTLIGSNVDILSGRRQHRFDDANRLFSTQGGEFKRTVIGPNAWLGNSAVIMAEVGENSVIGAGSVDVRPISAGVVAVGNPARFVRSIEMGKPTESLPVAP